MNMRRLFPHAAPRGAFALSPTVAVVLLSLLTPTFAFAGPAEDAVAKGQAAAKAKDWAAATHAYEEANTLKEGKDPKVLESLASAEFELGRFGESLDHYEALLSLLPGPASNAKRAMLAARLKTLASKTGTLELTVSVPGAKVIVNDHVLGVSPLRPFHVTAGPTKVRVEKEGFAPWERAPSVPATETAKVTATLEAESMTTRITVKEQSGKKIRVFLDGTDVGETPWTGAVTPGVHEVFLRGAGLLSEPQKVEITAGSSRTFELTAQTAATTLRVTTSDGKGTVYVDEALAGEGTASVVVPFGVHKVRVVREGYETYERSVSLQAREMYTENVTMKLQGAVVTEKVADTVRPLDGFYGGIMAFGALSPTKLGSTLETRCGSDKSQDRDGLGAICDTGLPLGGGIAGYFGHHWDPIGLEVFLLAQYDHTTSTAKFDGIGATAANKLAVGVARTEKFDIHRAGGIGALRARMTTQGKALRFSIAGGVGIAAREMILVRDAKADDGSNRANLFSPAGILYASGAVVGDASLGWRMSPSTALNFGILFTAENPGMFNKDVTQLESANNENLAGGTGVPVPIATPNYRVASGGQAFFGVFIGLQFGP